jgi:hypothetical protein
MAFEEIKENVEDIQDKAEAYIESNLYGLKSSQRMIFDIIGI